MNAPLALVSSAMTTASLVQNPPPMLIGERLNTQGSKKMKELLLAEDYDGIAALGREQIEGGAHTLDICVAMTERRDEAFLMSQVVRTLSQAVDAPLVIDTTEAEVLEVALEAAPAASSSTPSTWRTAGSDSTRCCRSSATTARPPSRSRSTSTGWRARRTGRWRSPADLRHRDAASMACRPDALIFDALTFTLATGDPESANTAVETLEGIRRIKAELPGVLTSLGVSQRLVRLQAGGTLGARTPSSCITRSRPASTWPSSIPSR